MEELKKIPEFDLAMTHAIKNNFELSKEYFLKVIDILNEDDSFNPAIFVLVLKKFLLLYFYF